MRGWLFLWSGWTSPGAQSDTLGHFRIEFFATKGLVSVVQFSDSCWGSVYLILTRYRSAGGGFLLAW